MAPVVVAEEHSVREEQYTARLCAVAVGLYEDLLEVLDPSSGHPFQESRSVGWF